MKLLSQGFFVALLMFVCTRPCGAQDVDDIFFKDFIKNEAVYKNQEIVMPRSSCNNPVTLRKQIESLMANEIKFIDAYVILSHSQGMESRYYSCADSVLDKDPLFFAFNLENQEIKRKYWEPNTVVYLGYKDDDGKKQYLVMHFRTRGFMNKSLYTRTSLMVSLNKNDDFRNYNSETSPLFISYLTVFDADDMTIDLYRFNNIFSVVTRKLQNGEPTSSFSELESIVYSGMFEVNESDYGYCNWLYENKRYYDAEVNYIYVFNILKKYARLGDKELNDTFYDICHKIGMSKWYGGFYDSAEYYLDLATYGSEVYKDDFTKFYDDKIVKRSDSRSSVLSNKLLLGEVLETLFDVKKSNLREAVCLQNDEFESIANSENVWNYDIYNLCDETSRALSIRYTRAKYEQEGEEKIDESRLYDSNNIIITTVPIGNSKWRVNIMIPNFKLGDYKTMNDTYNTPLNHSIIIGKKQNIKLNHNYEKEELEELYATAVLLKDDNRALEALMILKRLYSVIVSKTEDQGVANNMRPLLADVLFQCGFLLAEIGEPEKAIPYLRECYDITENSDQKLEYISNLSNITDPRTIDLIKDAIKLCDNRTSKHYMLFLKRRLAYILIEYKEFDEAKIILTELLNEPECAEFAKQELEYINSVYRR